MISSAPNDEDRRAYLEALARSGDDPLDIAEAALILASYERPGVPLERYRAHLQELITAARDRIDPQAPAADRVERLVEVIAGANRYEGDRRTYDDPFRGTDNTDILATFMQIVAGAPQF